MARQARIQSPTNYYHIMVRGNNREFIFNNPNQKTYYLEILKEQGEEGLIDIVAYCIMDNHAHIVVKADLSNLTKSMRSINIKYAMKTNKLSNRVGHVFQDRYKSEAIYDDEHLQRVLRYVHNNPVKAKISRHPKQYRWCSFNEYINKCEIIKDNERSIVLSYFGNNMKVFEDFHTEIDDNEYLEIKEDIKAQRLDRGQEIVQSYFKEQGVAEAKQIIRNPHHMETLIKLLLEKSKLTHREISNLLEINRGDVHRVNNGD